jgi:hypothetical protein
MGTIANGDFLAGFTGWTSNGAFLNNSGGSHFVELSWDYSWLFMPDEPPMVLATNSSIVSQTFVVPTNASYLTFMQGKWHEWYEANNPPPLLSMGEVRIESGGHTAVYYSTLLTAQTWGQTSLALPPEIRGQSATVEFRTSVGPGEPGGGGAYGYWQLDYVGFDAPGTTVINPLMPSGSGPGWFEFIQVPRNTWVDPATAWGFDYEMTGPSLFTKISDFPTGFGPLQVTADGQILGSAFGPGQSLDFVALLGHGVSEFTVTNISPLVDPTDPLCFPLKLDFNTDTASFNMTALPEPATLALVAAGVLGLVRRRR